MSFIIHCTASEIFVHRNDKLIFNIVKSCVFPQLTYIETAYQECQFYPYLMQCHQYVSIQQSELQSDYVKIYISGVLL